LLFLLQQIGGTDQFAIEAALSTLHNSSMLKRMPPDPRRAESQSQITLTDVASEYLARFAPPDRKFFEKVQVALKELRELVEKYAVQEAVYKYDLHAIRADTRDQRIAAAYLTQAIIYLKKDDLKSARERTDKAKALLPGYSEAYRIGALIESRASDYYRAAGEIEAAIQYDPRSSLAHYQYAVFLLSEMEDSQQGLDQIDKALALDANEPTLLTLRALALTRLGRCREAAGIYERLLEDVERRPRKWRITTRDQAAECYRRWAEQDETMKDGEALKGHLDRACHILEAACGKNDFDQRMGQLFTNIIEDELYFAIQSQDDAYAMQLLERLYDASHVLSCAPFRRLTFDFVAKAFGEQSPAVFRAKKVSDRVAWAPPRAADSTDRVSFRPGTYQGTIKAIPEGMPFGFIKDAEGRDWFFHKTSLAPANIWPTLKIGESVLFEGVFEGAGKRKATRVRLHHEA
jgi:tetratricopeptide (TPR) repeat protein/cold shock CspA family protein